MILRHFRLELSFCGGYGSTCARSGTVAARPFLIVCLGLLAGCATDPAPKKTVDDDPLSKQARQLRANSTDEPGTGLSDKSRDIEKDLGYPVGL